MNFKTDFFLKNSVWESKNTIENLGIFTRAVDYFIIACSIGIREDKRLPDDSNDLIITIGRNTLATNENVNRILTFLYENAVLGTKTLELTADERKKAAFDYENSNISISPTQLLTEFANYGMMILKEKISSHDLTTVMNIIDMMNEYKDMLDIDEDEELEVLE